MVLRFRKDTLDYEQLLKGEAAAFYPLVLQIHAAFGENPFTPKALLHDTGGSRSTVWRELKLLDHAGAVKRVRFGEYALSEKVSQAVKAAEHAKAVENDESNEA